MEAVQTRKGRGGARLNAGRPFGTLAPINLEKNEVLAKIRQRAMRNADSLFNAQLAKAVGSIQIFRIEESEDDNGKVKKEHILVTDTDEMKQVLDDNQGESGYSGDYFYIISTIQPDNKAIDSLLDRTFGKAQQTVDINHHTPDIHFQVLAFAFALTMANNYKPSQALEESIFIFKEKGFEVDEARLELMVKGE